MEAEKEKISSDQTIEVLKLRPALVQWVNPDTGIGAMEIPLHLVLLEDTSACVLGQIQGASLVDQSHRPLPLQFLSLLAELHMCLEL